MIRTIIIDDEPSAVSVLTTLLMRYCKEDIELLATAFSPEEGKQLIESLHPDLVFLDVEMPGMTGVDMLKSLKEPEFRVVFVTAHDGYALQAFRVNAVDYLLKPVGLEDLVKVIQKVKTDIRNELTKLTNHLQYLEKILTSHPAKSHQKIGIAMSDKIVFVNFSDIVYCEASGPYTYVFLTSGQKLISSKALGEFEAQLSGSRFFRIHHHYVINLNKVREFQRNDGGYVIMENGKELEVSQRKRKDFLDVIQDRVV